MAPTLVLDTSVLVSALLGPRGPACEVLRRCLLGHYRPLMGNALFAECEDVVSRPAVRGACPLTDAQLRELLNAYYSVCQWVRIYFLWRPNLPDEGDNFLVELAVAGNAQAIVTNNVRDLRAAELKFPSFSVVRPDQLLRGDLSWQP